MHIKYEVNKRVKVGNDKYRSLVTRNGILLMGGFTRKDFNNSDELHNIIRETIFKKFPGWNLVGYVFITAEQVKKKGALYNL